MKDHVIPSDWRMATLSEVAAPVPNAIVDGPFGSNLKLTDYVDQGVPVLQGKNITNDIFQWFDVRFISNSKASKLKRSIVRVGDVLIVKIGSIGYSAILMDLRGYEFAIIPANLAKVTPNHDVIDTRYLHRWLTSLDAKRFLESAASKTAQPALSLAKIKGLPVPLPPLPEQRRIAKVLDQTDALRAKRRAALAQLDALTRAIFFDMFGDPVKNPKRWPNVRLGDIATFVGGGTPSRARKEYFTGSVCWATSKDMKGEFLDSTEEHITDQAIQESATNLVPPGTILVVVKSKILAHHLPVAVTRVSVCFGQDLKGIKLTDQCEISFVATALRLGKRWLLERARGINTEGLTLDHLRAFPIGLPPVALQRDFALRIGVVEKLRTMHRGSLAELDALFASLQHRAFRGGL